MEIVKRLVEFATSPVGVMAILLAAGVILILRRRHFLAGRRLLAAGALLCAVYIFSPLAEVLIYGLEKDYRPLLAPEPESSPRRIVVLSGYGEEHAAVPVTSTISTETCCRLAEGIRLYRLLPGAKLVLSGGVLREGDKAVAGIMADFCRQAGIPAEDLIVEGASLTTYENLVQVQKMLENEPVILVTSGFGLRRALAVAGRLGMEVTPAPACLWSIQHLGPDMGWKEWLTTAAGGFAYPSLARLVYIQRAWHEHLGYLWYLLLGRL